MSAAPEWRSDPLTGRRVLISPDRGERPLHPTGHCPFCEGHETETPPEVLAYREPGGAANGPGWRVRVVPNRYAAVRMDAADHFAPVHTQESWPGTRWPGEGVAEVFVECPHHETSFVALSPSLAGEAIRAWRDRLAFWRQDGRLSFAQVFKNQGPAAGATVAHCHSQLIGVTQIPVSVLRELAEIRSGFDASGGCPVCERVGRERPRVVTGSSSFVVLAAFASRMPGEVWVWPRSHRPHFDRMDDDEVRELADLLCDVLRRIDRVFNSPDFNIVVKTAPFTPEGVLYHWRIEILPRTTSTAGWEWGTGLLINTMFPERAAELLRAPG